MRHHTAEILIVGAGIVGTTLARRLVQAGCENVVLLEKEPRAGLHASGRNSGVLHAGIYYAPDSLKARSCLNGNRLMRRYCKTKGLPLLEAGKVVVANGAQELDTLDELYRRAVANGARVRMIDAAELRRIEPSARTFDRALHSLETAMVDPKQVLAALQQDLLATGKVRILFGCAFTGMKASRVAMTTRGPIRWRRLVNAAGAHCDRVAHLFGVGRHLRIAPFKGIYWRLKRGLPYTVNGNIYPVPDIRNPFLGVHFTRSVHGDVHLGPTAIPAFGRENYGLLEGIDSEWPRILSTDLVLLMRNAKFRSVAFSEPRKYLKRFFFDDAQKLLGQLRIEDMEASPKVGIRPQLVDWRTKELVMDFMVVADGDALHVLNPISPAFTSSMDLADTLVREQFGKG